MEISAILPQGSGLRQYQYGFQVLYGQWITCFFDSLSPNLAPLKSLVSLIIAGQILFLECVRLLQLVLLLLVKLLILQSINLDTGLGGESVLKLASSNLILSLSDSNFSFGQ